MSTITKGLNTVIVHTDISQKISITVPIFIELQNVPNINTVNTNNLYNTDGNFVSSSTYSPVEENILAITLKKKEINYVKLENGDTNYWEDNLITSNLNVTSSYGYQCNIFYDEDLKTVSYDTATKYIGITLIDSYNDSRDVSIKRQFDMDSTYVVEIDFSKLGGTGIVEFQFITKSKSEQLLEDSKIKNNLNALYKLQNLLDLKNIDTIRDITNNTKFDYTFNTVSSNTLIPYKVSKIKEDLLIKEMLPDFEVFFRLLELDIEQNATTLEEQNVRYDKLRRVKYSLLQNAQVINSGVRGSIEGIRLIFNLYIENLSRYYYVSIESSPIGRNFVYRVTSSLPKHIWTTIIRPIVHPISWFDEYIELDIQDSTSNSNIPDNNTTIRNNKIYQQANQIDKITSTFLDFGNKCKGYSTKYHSYNLSSFGNLNSVYNYSFTDCVYYAQMYTAELYSFNDTSANVTYNLQIDDDLLYLVTVMYDGSFAKFLDLYSDRDGIANFRITVTNGILFVDNSISNINNEDNNFFIANDGYKTYVLDTDGDYLYLKSLPHHSI